MYIAGVDEAGRGPLAGPVVSAAVILDPENKIKGLTDSKLLTPAVRESLFEEICDKALAWSVAHASVEEIDELNILQAALLSMKRAIKGLSIKPNKVLVDGNQAPKINVPVVTIIGGDLSEPAISAASIVAKVLRDREMIKMDKLYPGYGFLNHKGYGTPAHMHVIKTLGPCPIHRKSFAPISNLLSLSHSKTASNKRINNNQGKKLKNSELVEIQEL